MEVTDLVIFLEYMCDRMGTLLGYQTDFEWIALISKKDLGLFTVDLHFYVMCFLMKGSTVVRGLGKGF